MMKMRSVALEDEFRIHVLDPGSETLERSPPVLFGGKGIRAKGIR
jgi:hypothetical protein